MRSVNLLPGAPRRRRRSGPGMPMAVRGAGPVLAVAAGALVLGGLAGGATRCAKMPTVCAVMSPRPRWLAMRCVPSWPTFVPWLNAMRCSALVEGRW